MNTSKNNDNSTIPLNATEPNIHSVKKSFYQPFTKLFSITAFVVLAAFLVMTWLISKQHKNAQILVSEYFEPKKVLLVEQKHLINSNFVIEKLLNHASFSELTPLLTQLSILSKKLSLLDTNKSSTYQLWLVENKAAIDFLSEVEAQHPNNQLLKSNMLILLDTLIDAIDVELSDGAALKKQKKVLHEAQNDLMEIVMKLNSLTLHSSLADFIGLSQQINHLFDKDFSNQLASKKTGNENIEEIVKDFLRFEDLIIKRRVLVRWQNQLSLLNKYQIIIQKQQKELTNILETLANTVIDDSTAQASKMSVKGVTVLSLPLEVLLFITFALLTVLFLLYFCFYKIKEATNFNVKNINEALKSRASMAKILDNQVPNLSAESLEIVQNIQKLCEQTFSEAEYLVQTNKNKALTKKIEKSEEAYEQLTNDILASKAERKINQGIEQCYLHELQQLVFQQIMQSSMATKNHESDFNSLEHINANESSSIIHNEVLLNGHALLNKLNEISYCQKLQDDSVTKAIDNVNFHQVVHASLLNLKEELQLNKNTISLSNNDTTLSVVSIDLEFFIETLRVFINLAFSHHKERHLHLSYRTVESDNGEKSLAISAQVSSKETQLILPRALNELNHLTEIHNKSIAYFLGLVSYQHGSKVFSKGNNEGYLLGFLLPLQINDITGKNCHSPMPFPTLFPNMNDNPLDIKDDYVAMPIEVLIAVKEPLKFKTLQATLNAIGLRTTFVANVMLLQSTWISGRFNILMTDFNYHPYIDFISGGHNQEEPFSAIPRGVISLTDEEKVFTAPKEFAHWHTGKLTSQSRIDDVIALMQPWTKVFQAQSKHKKGTSKIDLELLLQTPVDISVQQEFDIARYISNQGSVELALFMLDEYILENKVVMSQLEVNFNNNDIKLVNEQVQKLRINGTILGAKNLLDNCNYWQKIIDAKALDSKDKAQTSLLKKTQKTVESVSQYAENMA